MVVQEKGKRGRQGYFYLSANIIWGTDGKRLASMTEAAKFQGWDQKSVRIKKKFENPAPALFGME